MQPTSIGINRTNTVKSPADFDHLYRGLQVAEHSRGSAPVTQLEAA